MNDDSLLVYSIIDDIPVCQDVFYIYFFHNVVIIGDFSVDKRKSVYYHVHEG